MLCGIMVGMDQKVSFYVHKPLAVSQVQFLDKVICPWWYDSIDGLDSAENCGVPTGAVLGRFRPDSAEPRDDWDQVFSMLEGFFSISF